MIQKLGIEQSKVVEMCFELYKYYGTTMAGLRAIGYQFDYDDYHGFVHGRLPYELLKPDPVLRNLLLSLPIRKIILTNSDKGHTSKVLERLGLDDCFDGIICFETLNPTHESNVSQRGEFQPTYSCYVWRQIAFTILMLLVLFFDDSVRNLTTASRMGLQTVLVGKSERPKGVDYVLESIHNIKEAFPELLEAEEKSEDRRYSQEIAIETSVEA
ncbi:hypothetical protein Ancab_011605 [Ancistrocladus abbreviatus]